MQRDKEGIPESFFSSPSATKAADASSSSSSIQQDQQALVDPDFGYARLGRLEAGQDQLEGGVSGLQLHPNREFRHGDVYQAQVGMGRWDVGPGAQTSKSRNVGSRFWWCWYSRMLVFLAFLL